MVKAASPAALDKYEQGIEELVCRFPNSWGIIFHADETVRFQRSGRIREDFLYETPLYDIPVAFDKNQPWEFIISRSAFGSAGGLLEHWWDQHVKHPAGLRPAESSAFVAHVDGAPPPFSHMLPPRKVKGLGWENNGDNRQPWLSKILVTMDKTGQATLASSKSVMGG